MSDMGVCLNYFLDLCNEIKSKMHGINCFENK